MVLDSKSTIKSSEGEYRFRKTVITVATYTAILLTAALISFGVVQNSEILTFSVLIVVTAILAVEAIVYTIRPYIRQPTIRMQKIEKRLANVNREIEKKEKYLKELESSAYGLARFVKEENIGEILSKIAVAADVENVNLWLSGGTDLVLAADWGVNATSPGSVKIPLSAKSGATYSFKTGKTIISQDASKDSRLSSTLARVYDIRNMVCIPLKVGGEVIGVLVAKNKKHGAFTRFDVNYLRGARYPLATAVQNVNLVHEMDRRLEEERYFITDLAHYLKTPLTSLRSELELAISGGKKRNQLIQVITHGVETIEKISRTLERSMKLAYYEMTNQKGSEFDLEKVTGEVFEMSNLVASQKNIKFSYKSHGPLAVVGEEDKVFQAVLCILDNAIKYTPQGGRVDLSLAKMGNMAHITISDTGYGIEKEEMEMIFKRFWRGKASDGDSSIGLGLSIANSIISAHRGQIKVKSEPNRGTRFTILLPLAASGAGSAKANSYNDEGQTLFSAKPALNN